MAPHVFIRDGSHSNPVLRPVDIDNMSYDELLDLERQLGQVRSPGASMEQISELPAFAYHRAPDDKKQSSAAPKSCAICMEELAPSTGCGYSHHNTHQELKQLRNDPQAR